ncbi:hypothetical protein [Bacillus luti]|uniref:hypothetical protein n=1 Tax=Bacillus luti TaxID=2026191 RepID=UPI003D0216DD
MKEKPKLKNLYKKTLAIELIKMGHDLHHTMRNWYNPKYQVYVFKDTPELRRDMARINNQEYTGHLTDDETD